MVVPNSNTRPMIYGTIVFLYSAFSSTLPSIYFIPIKIQPATATITPKACTIANIDFPIFALYTTNERTFFYDYK